MFGRRSTDSEAYTVEADAVRPHEAHNPGWMLEKWDQPAGRSGGDFVIYRRDPHCIRLLVCDVTGHGDQAAAVARETRRMLEADLDSPVDESALRRWSDVLERASHGRFVCFSYVEIDLATRRAMIANAGNPPVVVLRGFGGGVEVFPATGMPLGIVESDCWVAPHFEPVTLGADDVIVCFTDGLPDQLGLRRQPFGLDRVFATLKESRDTSLVRSLGTRAALFADRMTEQDDLTIVSLADAGRRAA